MVKIKYAQLPYKIYASHGYTQSITNHSPLIEWVIKIQSFVNDGDGRLA